MKAGVLSFGLLLLVAAGLLLASMGVIAAPPVTAPGKTEPEYWSRNRLRELPWTQHALNDHPERGIGTKAVWEWMVRKQCRPLLLYICTDEQEVMFTCPAPESGKLLVGLVAGWLQTGGTPKVVTGFPAAGDYWQNATYRAGCTGPYLIP